MIHCVCYFFFPLFEMLSLALCHEGVVRLSTLYTSNLMKSPTSAGCVCSVVLLTLSHWLYDISSSISNSVNLFLMNFSRARYPGQFLQQSKIGGIKHYHSHQVLIHDVKLWNFYIFVFRFLNFPFQLGFYSRTKTLNKLFGVLMVITNT